ncbi:MAG: RNB domain-containing ribonuclease [Zoogloeaceae bacterium]|jgi:exoribonuclease-2|nr:RNB domain-containing ribonuclease [Zoogloeaceae bacterium]
MTLTHVLFEESGSFKTGSILADHETSLQLEMPSGKRCKIKSAQALLRFDSPPPASLLTEAEPLAGKIDVAFLWEIAGEKEFSFHDLASEYYGHDPTAPEAASMLLALHGAPVYFHRKGKGLFRKAAADILGRALAALEKKRQQAANIEAWIAELIEGRLPEALHPWADSLLGKPDRNRPEIKAFEGAAERLSCDIPELLLKVGALSSPYEAHLRRFLLEQFPKGTDFPPLPPFSLPDDLPLADTAAFSIDDAATTEVDDAFSVLPLPEGGWRIGIHIAAPGLVIHKGDALDAIARARLSTVYMPGAKITMLPDPLVAACTLEGGQHCPAVSLYLTVDEALEITDTQSRIEQIHIAANLRHHGVEPWFNIETLAAGTLPERPFRDELVLLWRFAKAIETRRGNPFAMESGLDYAFAIHGDLAAPERCRVDITPRPRGSPLDKLVSELMIIANTTWSGLLAQHEISCLYRTQTGGKARMSTVPQPHEGLGVPQYAWMTSPLRRYSDLLNQWQLIALLRNAPPLFPPRSSELFAAMRDFEATYTAYANFQRRIERYWCLRWLVQEDIRECMLLARHDELARFERLPLFTRISGTGDCPPGQRMIARIESVDFIQLEVRCHLLKILAHKEIPFEVPARETDDMLAED